MQRFRLKLIPDFIKVKINNKTRRCKAGLKKYRKQLTGPQKACTRKSEARAILQTLKSKGVFAMNEVKSPPPKTGHQDGQTVTFRVNATHLSQMSEMKDFYALEDLDELFALMLKSYYEDYILEKRNEQTYDEMITDLHNRLGKLEDKFSKIYEPLK